MKAGGQKTKGNGYEIKIARILSKWYWKGKSTGKQKSMKNHDYFWRTAGSGAKATVTRRGETSFVGDIVFLPSPDRFKVWVDTKNRKDVKFDNILLAEKFLPLRWYREEIKKRNSLKIIKPVVVIFKLYRKKEDYIFFHRESLQIAKWENQYLLDNIIEWREYAIMKFNSFLESVDREVLIDD